MFCPLLGVPVLREGNVINLPAMPLEVAEACSGIRSLMSLLTLAIIYGYLMEKRLWVRWTLAIASIPITVFANDVRIVGTGLLVQYWDPQAAEGYFHASWGWIIFVVSLVMLYALHALIRWLVPEKGGRTLAASSAGSGKGANCEEFHSTIHPRRTPHRRRGRAFAGARAYRSLSASASSETVPRAVRRLDWY